LVVGGCFRSAILDFQKYDILTVYRHFGFIGRVLGPPTWWFVSLCQIWLQSLQYFRLYESFNILCAWLENTYSRPKIGVFGGLIPLLENNINVTTKRH